MRIRQLKLHTVKLQIQTVFLVKLKREEKQYVATSRPMTSGKHRSVGGTYCRLATWLAWPPINGRD